MSPHSSVALPDPSPTGYTAAQLAAALGYSKPTALKALQEIPPANVVVVSGNETNAWSFDQLPSAFKERLAKCAVRNGLGIGDYMESSARPWAPRVPVSKVSQVELQRAWNLKEALLPSIGRRLDTGITQAERLRLGLDDFRAAFGHNVSAKRWRYLLSRTLRRARWDEDYSRTDIYLDDQDGQAAAAPKVTAQPCDELRPLRCLIEGMVKNGGITQDQKRLVLDDAFQITETMAAKLGSSAARREVVCFLHQQAPFLAKNQEALRRNFDRLYQKWLGSGRALQGLDDKRRGRARPPAHG
jgi:hypothetical protein